MFWEVLWPLVLGFGLSAIVQGPASARKCLTGGRSTIRLLSATMPCCAWLVKSACATPVRVSRGTPLYDEST
jgi:hypothetical protein